MMSCFGRLAAGSFQRNPEKANPTVRSGPFTFFTLLRLFMKVVKILFVCRSAHTGRRQKAVPEEGKSHVIIGIFYFFTFFGLS